MIPQSILQHTATIQPYEGETGAGGPSFGAGVVVRCLIQPKNTLVFGPNARQVQAKAKMFCLPGTVIPPESRVAYRGEVYRVIESSAVPGPSGESHVEATLG